MDLQPASSGNENSSLNHRLVLSGKDNLGTDLEKALSEALLNSKHPDSDTEQSLSDTHDTQSLTDLHSDDELLVNFVHILQIQRICWAIFPFCSRGDMPSWEFLYVKMEFVWKEM